MGPGLGISQRLDCHENGELGLPLVSSFVHDRGLGCRTKNKGAPRCLLLGPEVHALDMLFLDQ